MCWADVNQIKELLQSALTGSSDGVPQQGQDLRMHDASLDLTADEVASVLPLAARCLKSPRPEARQAGLELFLRAALMWGSSKLIEPYLDDFEAILSGPSSPFRQGVIAVLAITKPALSPKASRILSAHLEDKTNSLEETEGITYALIDGSHGDQAMIHRVISFAEARSEDRLTGEVIRVVGLIRTRNAEAVDLIGKGLESKNKFLREAAVKAAVRMDRDVRVKFAAQLGRIASDPDEQPQVRSWAADAISK